MRAEYCVEPTVKVYIDPDWEIPDKMHIGGADVYFEISADKILKKIKIAYIGLSKESIEARGEHGKGILTNQGVKELTSKAFKVMSYILNYIQIEKKVSIFDTRELKNIQPAVSTENQEEEQYLSMLPKRSYSDGIYCSPNISANVSFDNIEEHFEHAKAYADFADAKNVQNPITKYESLYKVIDKFFSGIAEKIDQNVSNFMIKFDSNFKPKHFEELRQLRNRCVHSKDKNHVTSGDVELLEEVSGKTEKLERIAELLLKHK